MKIPSASIPSALLCFSLAISPAALAQTSEPVLKLTGIARIGDRECVVLEVPQALRPGNYFSETVILHADERLAGVEVKSIRLAEGAVDLIYHGSNMLVRLDVTSPTATARNQINLTNAPLPVVVELYAKAAGRTLLLHPLVPAARLAITGSAEDPAALVQIFAQALTNHGIAIVPDGEKFLQLVPQHLAEKVQARSGELKSTTSTGAAETDLPAGAISFIRAKMSQIAPIYASLIGREFDRAGSPALNHPLPEVSLKTQIPLSKSEVLYALDVELAWGGVKMVVVDDKRVRLALLNEQ